MEQYIFGLPKANWILKQSGLPWLKLQISTPFNDILNEWKNVKHLAVNHRESDQFYNLKNKGWKSLTLFGASSTTTEKTNEEYNWTDISIQCPKTVNWIKENFIIDNNTGRIRFMFLEPNGYILPHKDTNERGLFPINVAISQPENCYFKFANYGIIPFKNGESYLIDTSYEHAVYNKSDFERLHIILHTKINEKIVENSYATCYHNF